MRFKGPSNSTAHSSEKVLLHSTRAAAAPKGRSTIHNSVFSALLPSRRTAPTPCTSQIDPFRLGPVDKYPCPESDSCDLDEAEVVGCSFVVSSGDAA